LFLTRGLHFRSESATNIRSKRPVLFLFVDRKTRTSIRLNYILHPVLFYHRRPTVFCSVSLIIHVRRSRCGVDAGWSVCWCMGTACTLNPLSFRYYSSSSY